MVVIFVKLSLNAVQKIVRRNERCLGSRCRKIISNEHDLIIIDDAKVYLILTVVRCYCIDVSYVYYLYNRYIYNILYCIRVYHKMKREPVLKRLMKKSQCNTNLYDHCSEVRVTMI